MDLRQTKLTRAEWDSIEIPISDSEKQILKLIMEGYADVNIRTNETMSMFAFTKIEQSAENEIFLYKKYFDPIVQKMIKKYGGGDFAIAECVQPASVTSSALKKMKSIDSMRIQNLESNIEINREFVFEFLILDLCAHLCKNIGNKKSKYAYYLYTLIQLKKTSIRYINTHVTYFIDNVIRMANARTELGEIIENAYDFIERNPYLLKYEDKELFPHQKQLFSIFKKSDARPKLVLYIAPTGTGKTLSPIGLVQGKNVSPILDTDGSPCIGSNGMPICIDQPQRVIFVCVARHIGLALAKSAISMEKKIAFAFGCETASDIRLHYFAAVNYTKHRKSGGIGKVDNSVGTNVEIIICDVQSYLVSMYYMLSFNKKENIITYWDEPTISMDYETHDLHDVIHRNWVENKIPNIVLSCATLPNESEIISTIGDFRERFDGAEIHTITSYDCKKSIPILNKTGYCVLPHTLYPEYAELLTCVEYCDENKTLLRYFDLPEIIRFIVYVNKNKLVDESYVISSYFASISDITMNRLKTYYLEIMKRISPEQWPAIYTYMKNSQSAKFDRRIITKVKSMSHPEKSNKLVRTSSVSDVGAANIAPTANTNTSGILITTSDAYTLTDGPTIFITEDVNKVGNFYIQQSNIHASAFQLLLRKIAHNSHLSDKITALEQTLEDKMGNDKNDDAGENKRGSGKEPSRKLSKGADMDKMSPEIRKMTESLEALRKEIQYICLDAKYIPNTKPHQEIWAPAGQIVESAFIPSIDETTVKNIMALSIDNHLKILLLLGIGLFIENPNPKYMEIMKTLANEQRLFMIIASSDYIYGTNYQFCHGFIGKDLTNMTQQKTLQAMGRIGRNNIQQSYTVRFRDDDILMGLFRKPERNLEAENMSKLFNSDL